MTPGRKFSTTTSTSAPSSSRRRTIAGSLRSPAMLRLFLLKPRKLSISPSVLLSRMPHERIHSPPGCSTLITSAPRSPRICVSSGPCRSWVKSSTRTCDNGPVAAVLSSPCMLVVSLVCCLSARGEPVEDVLLDLEDLVDEALAVGRADQVESANPERVHHRSQRVQLRRRGWVGDAG